MEIKSTTDYDKFSNIIGNRKLNQKKIDNIVNDIEKGLNLLPYCPIICYGEKDELNIIDGQHRFEVSKITELPVYYVVCEKLSLQQIASLNSKQDKWTAKDFLNCYMNVGIKDYKILQEVMTEYHIGISIAIELLQAGGMGKTHRLELAEDFRNGNFKISFYDQTIELLELNHSLFDRYTFYKDRYLISAVQALKEKGLCDFDVLREKIAAAPMMMDKQGTLKDYIYNIERVYNYKNSIRQIIF